MVVLQSKTQFKAINVLSCFLHTLETKEAAFVYALASGTIVHTVAHWCAKNDSKVDYCGCDQTLGNETLLHNEKWAGCFPDIHFGINFTKQLVNARVNNATPRYKAFVVHNSEIGQLVSSYTHMYMSQ